MAENRPGAGAPGSPQRPIDHQTPADADRCDFLDKAVCLQPFPNDYFTRPDRASDTGRRLSLHLLSMPRNRAGKPIDPTDYNRNDGFSPGAPISTKIPGLDTQPAFERSGIVPVTDMAKAFAPRQPLVVINTRTRGRHLVWGEIDSNPDSPEDVNLIVRPGRNFEENTRYIVALRRLVGADGDPLVPTKDFRLYRDGIHTTNETVERRRGGFESIFTTLAEAGVDRDSLHLAWDFTVASERNLSERVLAIRDDAFKRLGDENLADLQVAGGSPPFTITRVQENPNEKLARLIEGRMTVPCYLDRPGCPAGSRFTYASADDTKPTLQPIPGNTYDATFRCIVPRVAVGGGARPSLYGHGLFGSRGEVTQPQLQDMAQEHNFVFCATEWIGMACADLPDQSNPVSVLTDALAGDTTALPNCDIPNVATILGDLSNFSTLTDRVQQGMVNFTYLGRAMLTGFNGHPAFQFGAGGVLDTRRLFYDGNSQGGIIGGSLMAILPDADRGVLGVPGMNYSTLLTRSKDFGDGEPPSGPELPSYAFPMYQAYPNEIERPLIFSLIQTLWDRAEANGYAHHMTSDPLPNTPAHEVMLHGGLGDWQVAQVSAEVEARTIGAATHRPYADAGRTFDVQPAYAIPRIGYPFAGSGLFLWDTGPPRRDSEGKPIGTNPPPPSNTLPPTEPPDSSEQQDPHEIPRRTPHVRRQKAAFLQIGGQIVDVCGARPCYAGSWAGP